MWATGGVGLMLTYIKLRPQGKSVDDPVIERTATSEFSGTVENSYWYSKLPLAPWWACLYSMSLYLYIWGAGLMHLGRATLGYPTEEKRLEGDMTLLCAVYATESIAALVLECSTMVNWRRLDFSIHHLPFCVVGLTWILMGNPVAAARFTWPLCMLTSLNEAIAAARGLGAPSWIDIPNRFYLCVIMVLLVVAETTEALMSLFGSDSTVSMRACSVLTLVAPFYHAGAVLPHCLKVCTRWTKKQFAAEPDIKQKDIKAH